MKNILIVDKSPDWRSTLRSLIEAYSHEEHLEVSIYEATDGSEAVMFCDQEEFDLIFTGIVMDEMDGVRATELIRRKNPKVMIIAVSASEDSELIHSILHSGAEDYIAKPINPDIFNARLTNYIALINSRRRYLSMHTGHNLFGETTYARTVSFCIKNYDVLAEFWEYYLLQETGGSSQLVDTVRAIHDIGSLALKRGVHPCLWIEESDHKIYFTLEKLSDIKPSLIRKILSKNQHIDRVKTARNSVSISYTKEAATPQKEVVAKSAPSTFPSPFPEEKPSENESALVAPNYDIPTSNHAPHLVLSDEKHIFNYMDEEDLEDIKEYLSRLNTLLLLVGSGDIAPEEVDEISYYIDRISKAASIYPESYQIAVALGKLASTISNNVQMFIDKSSSLGLFCKTFGLDLMNWIQMVFYDGAPSVNFMDDTIISNAQMLGSMIESVEIGSSSSSDMDDIFDF